VCKLIFAPVEIKLLKKPPFCVRIRKDKAYFIRKKESANEEKS
jgi:hypothetical protein